METAEIAVERDIVDALYQMRKKGERVSKESLAQRLARTVEEVSRYLEKDYNLGSLFEDLRRAS